MVKQCPKCGHRIYEETRAPRRPSVDPSSLVDLPGLADGDQWVTVEQVGRELRVRPNSVHAMVSRNGFPKADYKWRGRNYWKRSTVDRWFKESRQVIMMPAEGWPERDPADASPRGKGGRFIKTVERVEIRFDS
jgi:hypothetical protein